MPSNNLNVGMVSAAVNGVSSAINVGVLNSKSASSTSSNLSSTTYGSTVSSSMSSSIPAPSHLQSNLSQRNTLNPSSKLNFQLKLNKFGGANNEPGLNTVNSISSNLVTAPSSGINTPSGNAQKTIQSLSNVNNNSNELNKRNSVSVANVNNDNQNGNFKFVYSFSQTSKIYNLMCL